ncbi:MAG TPA: hypothetical protein VGH10_12880 [Actinomycetota bacterium]|jgi:hypothetical protein
MMKALRLGLASTLALAVLSVAPAAFASHGGGHETSGSCSGTSDWKLKLSPEDGRIEVEFEVDQNVVGDTWGVRMRDNGVMFFKGQATTEAPSGSFEVRVLADNQPGTDKIQAQAKNLSTGEICSGTGSI